MRYGIRLLGLLAFVAWMGLSGGAATALPLDGTFSITDRWGDYGLAARVDGTVYQYTAEQAPADLQLTISGGDAHLVGDVLDIAGTGLVNVDIHFDGIQWTGDKYEASSIYGTFAGKDIDCSVAGAKGDCVFHARFDDDDTLRMWTWLGDNRDLQILDLDAKLWAHREQAPVPEPGAALLFAIGTAAVFRRQRRR